MINCLLIVIKLFICWEPNPESDVSYYTVYWGNNGSRNYIFSRDIFGFFYADLELTDTNTRYYFAVTATDTAGNESVYSDEVWVDVTDSGKVITKVTDDTILDFVSIYPNPCRSYIIIKSNQYIGCITIYNNLGRIVFKDNISDLKYLKYDVNLLPSGVYYVVIYTKNNKIYNNKFTVIK